MDKLGGLAEKAKGALSNQGAAGGQQKPAAGAGGQEDYGDKGLDAAEKHFGASQSRETNEKITDGVRGAFEKATGKDVPNKFSN